MVDNMFMGTITGKEKESDVTDLERPIHMEIKKFKMEYYIISSWFHFSNSARDENLLIQIQKNSQPIIY